MKVRRLIEELQKFNPESRVYFGSWMGKGRNEILCCFAFKDNEEVILETAEEFDTKNEIKEMFDAFIEEGWDEADAYREMIDFGYTPQLLKWIGMEDEANHMEEFCKEHGIIID